VRHMGNGGKMAQKHDSPKGVVVAALPCDSEAAAASRRSRSDKRREGRVTVAHESSVGGEWALGKFNGEGADGLLRWGGTLRGGEPRWGGGGPG
jgi:hypothetical protein